MILTGDCKTSSGRGVCPSIRVSAHGGRDLIRGGGGGGGDSQSRRVLIAKSKARLYVSSAITPPEGPRPSCREKADFPSLVGEGPPPETVRCIRH